MALELSIRAGHMFGSGDVLSDLPRKTPGRGVQANVKTALFGRALNAAAHYCVFVRFVNRNSLLLVGVSIL